MGKDDDSKLIVKQKGPILDFLDSEDDSGSDKNDTEMLADELNLKSADIHHVSVVKCDMVHNIVLVSSQEES